MKKIAIAIASLAGIISLSAIIPAAVHNTEGFFIFVAVMLAYFLPTIISVLRHTRSTGQTAVWNTFFGWTVIGWVICLGRAFR